MARPSDQDPIEKFRFSITVVSVDLSVTAGVDALAAAATSIGQASGGGLFSGIGSALALVTRAGFSEVVLPKANINSMTYRENIDAQRFSKIPGLTSFEPVVLRRGVTGSRDLYNWYRLVNDDISQLVAGFELGLTATKAPPQNKRFRKEVIINVHNRDGEPVKQWILFNAYPSAYKGGNDLDASSSEKLVEELTLEYELFLEVEGGLEGLLKEQLRDTAERLGGNFLQEKIPSIMRS